MKKRILSLALFLFLSFFSVGLASTVSAQDVCADKTAGTFCDPLNGACTGSAARSSVCQRDTTTNPISGKDGVLLRASVILAYVIGITCIIIIIIAGIRYMMSQGDSTAINSAKNQILYALLGLVVVIMARTIIVFVVSRV